MTISDIPALFGNGILMLIWGIGHTEKINYSSVINILCQPITESLTSECQHLQRNTCSHYIEKGNFQDHYMKHILLSCL